MPPLHWLVLPAWSAEHYHNELYAAWLVDSGTQTKIERNRLDLLQGCI